MEDFIDFEPMTEQQIQESGLLPDGRYQADVFDAFDRDKNGNFLITKNGVRKFETILHVYDNEGKTRKVNCTLTPSFMKLFKHFFVATGQEEAYNAKKININNVRNKKNFLVDIKKRTYTSDKTGEVVTVNNITDFLSMDKKLKETAESFFNDELTF